VAWTGIALILSSGLLMLWREAIAKKITNKNGPLRTHR